MENQPKTIEEAWNNLTEAVRELCETSLKMGVAMDELKSHIRKFKRMGRLNVSRKSYQSPYAIFDKFRKKKR